MKIQTLAQSMNTSASGLTAERFRMDIISANIANANTVATRGQEPYRRRGVILTSGEQGVQITNITQDFKRPFSEKVDYTNPDADPVTGKVKMSNVDPLIEMVDMIGASRSYEANLAAFNSARTMEKSALNIGRV